MNCWKCGVELENYASKRIEFRATCDSCHAWLHCCCNCINYKPGLPNDCKIPGTESISDREAKNFCEEFALLGTFKNKPNINEISKNLFGDDPSENQRNQHPKDKFKSLFKED